ncbi:MAG: hypothetical protein ACI9TH_002089 [Kiritimatiellia bacterium]|jgi:hypothetical protein
MNFFRMLIGIPILLAGTGISYATLVAYYPLDTDALDASGNGHHGTVTGSGVTYGQAGANGATGQSTDFTGSGHINVPYSPALNTPDFTVTLWANADVAGGGGGNYRSPITNRDDVSGVTYGWIIYNDNAGNWNFWNGQGASGWPQLSGGAVATTTWTHLAISYDSATSTKSFYVNGNLAGTANAAFAANGPQMEALHLGGGGDDGTQFRFDGRIDDVGLFDHVLDQAAIQNIMVNGVIPEPASGVLFLLGLSLLRAFRLARK